MRTWTLTELERIVRLSWGADTCDPVDLAEWHPGNPSVGQCGVTALVIQDLLGGGLILAKVHEEGERRGYHYWNRLGGLDIDLTREQFGPRVVVTEGSVVDRPPGPPRRCQEQYETFRGRVLEQLQGGDPGAATVGGSRAATDSRRAWPRP